MRTIRSATMTALLAMLALFAAAGAGCISVGSSERRYLIDLKNTSDRTIAVDMLVPEGRTLGRIHADLGPGGAFTNRFTLSDASVHPEARFRPFPARDTDPFVAFDLAPGENKYDLSTADGGGRVLFTKRPVPWDTSPP
jgi:hypothetical protein